MRTVKTAVAVTVCFFIFLPLWQAEPTGNPLDQIGPFYACIAAVICMQSSVEQSLRHGLSRLLGTGVGGCVGIVILWLAGEESGPFLFGVFMGLGVLVTIWLCSLLGHPAACSIGGVVCCAVLLSHSGPERYVYTLTRMGETAVGIFVAVAVNHLLPDRRAKAEEKENQA